MDMQQITPFAIEGIEINLRTRDETLAQVVAARGGDSYALYTLNLDHCVKLRKSAAFRNAYAQARFVTADGAPVAWLARLLRVRLSRVTGADLVDPLCAAAAANGLKVFLYGTSPEVLSRTADVLRSRHPDLSIVGSMAPGPMFNPDGAEASVAIEAIRAAGADLCLVALGAPKQELFAFRAAQETYGCGFICIGAALDFIAGAQVRAPAFFQRLGAEWVWRLVSDPARMWRRYAGCAGVMGLYLFQAIQRRLQSRTHIGPAVRRSG